MIICNLSPYSPEQGSQVCYQKREVRSSGRAAKTVWLAQCPAIGVLPQCHPYSQDCHHQGSQDIYSKLSSEFPYNTRLAEADTVRMGPDFQAKLDLTSRSFMNRATVNFNQLPAELRKITKTEIFKSRLKIWVIENYKL